MRVRTVSAIALLCLATACSHGPRKIVNPPRASVQQLQVRPDGQWALTLRLQNFSNVSTAFASMHARLRIGGQDCRHFGSVALGLVMRAHRQHAAGIGDGALEPALAPGDDRQPIT